MAIDSLKQDITEGSATDAPKSGKKSYTGLIVGVVVAVVVLVAGIVGLIMCSVRLGSKRESTVQISQRLGHNTVFANPEYDAAPQQNAPNTYSTGEYLDAGPTYEDMPTGNRRISATSNPAYEANSPLKQQPPATQAAYEYDGVDPAQSTAPGVDTDDFEL